MLPGIDRLRSNPYLEIANAILPTPSSRRRHPGLSHPHAILLHPSFPSHHGHPSSRKDPHESSRLPRPKKVSVDNVPDPKIENPTDVIIKLTTTNICGSDLHMYEGRTDVEKGKIFGHENLGEVIEVGPAVDRVKIGDRVVPAVQHRLRILRNCERGLTGFCLTSPIPVMPGMRGRLRLRRYGTLRRRPGRSTCASPTPTSTACAARRRRGKRERLRHALRHLPHRLALHRARRPGARRYIVIYGAGPVGLMAGSPRASRAPASLRRGPTGPAQAGRRNRRHPIDTTAGTIGRTDPANPPAARAQTAAASASATSATTRRAKKFPT